MIVIQHSAFGVLALVTIALRLMLFHQSVSPFVRILHIYSCCVPLPIPVHTLLEGKNTTKMWVPRSAS